jgi:hypothetical protein
MIWVGIVPRKGLKPSLPLGRFHPFWWSRSIQDLVGIHSLKIDCCLSRLTTFTFRFAQLHATLLLQAYLVRHPFAHPKIENSVDYKCRMSHFKGCRHRRRFDKVMILQQALIKVDMRLVRTKRYPLSITRGVISKHNGLTKCLEASHRHWRCLEVRSPKRF